MKELELDSIKEMMEFACKGAATLMESFTKEKTEIEIIDLQFGDSITLYLKYNGEVMFKKVWQLEDATDADKGRLVVLGALMVEMIVVFCMTVTRLSKDKIVDEWGKPIKGV